MKDQAHPIDFSLADLEQRGIEAMEDGETEHGRDLLEKIPEGQRSVAVDSYLAWCLATSPGFIDKAKNMCADAIRKEPSNPVHYLNFGRIYLAAGDKREAIRMFRDGLLFGNNRLIRKELDKLGWRTPPVFPSLGRENPVNRILGCLRSKLGKAGF